MSRAEVLQSPLPAPEYTIVRIRKSSGLEGKPNYYHHADVIVKNEEEALAAAREGRIVSWRRIDSFDTAKRNYIQYEALGRIDPSQARKASLPLTAEERARLDRG